MKRLFFPLYSLVFLLAVSAQGADLPVKVAPDLVVIEAEFGLVTSLPRGEVDFEPASNVPLVENQAYGWRLKLKTGRARVAVREEFVLPAAPDSWGADDGKTNVSHDGKLAVSSFDLVPVDGIVMNSWSVAKGDPSGKHTMRVFVEGKLVATFEFTATRESTSRDTVSADPQPSATLPLSS